ncbi:MAG TPA: hypothetical protein VN540_01260 [Clostridia bacterium]|nr:hypothetical protein [Clostridia bacterium]
MLLRFLYILAQCTWGFPQSFLGFLLFLALGRQKHVWHGYALMTVFDSENAKLKWPGCVSLGMFTFVNVSKNGSADPRIAAHEYGHTFQSLLLGPLYLIAVGIPSSLWALRYMKNRAQYGAKGIAYTARYPENWAEHWGRRAARHAIAQSRMAE